MRVPLKIGLVIIMISLACASCSPGDPPPYRFPGEFENQQAIFLQWPSDSYNEGSQPVNPVIIEIIRVLQPYIRVNLMVQSQDTALQVKKILNDNGVSDTNVNYFVVDHRSIWTRDVGPIFVKDSNNNLSIVDFGFNNYSRDGSQDYINIEGQVHKTVAGILRLPLVSTNLISEGGAIESNGKGTLMTTESVALMRNPGMTKQQIEKEYKRVLGVKKVIWLKNGLTEDDTITGGHINEIARFTDPNTVLLAEILPGDRYANSASESSYLRLEENYRILLNSTDQDGNPFRIIRIPMPPTLYQEANKIGKVHVYSYLNYAVTNGAVLMQTYWKPGRAAELKTTEDKVKNILQSVFPGRKVIGINAENVNLWGGGIHCITQHMPAS